MKTAIAIFGQDLGKFVLLFTLPSGHTGYDKDGSFIEHSMEGEVSL